MIKNLCIHLILNNNINYYKMENLAQYPEKPKMLVKTVEQSPQWDNYQIYNKQCTFKLENYGLIKMLFLKFTVDTGLISSFFNPTSPFLIDSATMECNGIQFARTNTAYTLARIDRLKGTSLYDQMLKACTIQEDPLLNAQTISLPLFFYTIDGQMINPNDYQNLTVSVRTASSKEAMGFDEELTRMDIKLFMVFEQMEKYPMKETLKNSYNIAEDITQIPIGSTTTIVKLNNPSEILSLIFLIRNESGAIPFQEITSVKVDCPTSNIGTFDNLTNFTLNSSVGVNDGSTFQIDFASYIKANKNMFPLIITVNHANTIVDAYLSVTYEYRSVVEDLNGFLFETFDEKL